MVFEMVLFCFLTRRFGPWTPHHNVALPRPRQPLKTSHFQRFSDSVVLHSAKVSMATHGYTSLRLLMVF